MAAYSDRPANTVIYKLFTKEKEEVSGCNFPVNDRLEIAAENYVSKVSGFLKRYIWQNDSFNLNVTETESLPHLEGITCFDDNVEDEWFIVYLLYYLTNADKNLVVQIQDEDGEFLLIEAAEYLPKWLNPDTSINRVFIYQGSLHIIPIAHSPADVTPFPSGAPSLSSAVPAVRELSSLTKAPESVQQAVKNRIMSYPQKIDECKHRAHCYVPCAVAAILKEDPQLVSPAVKAFYHRDPLDMQACTAMKYFAPETCILTEVIFTRCLYAQLSSQDYEPDKRTGWNFPSNGSVNLQAYKLGMKLACGFEIIAANAEKQMSTDDECWKHDFANDVRWKRFSKSLKDKGYFKGEVEGTQLYQRLLLQAQDFYLSSLMKNCSDPGVRIQKLLQSVNIHYEELKEAEKLLRPPDDDSWMNITPDVLDSMLEKMSKHPSEAAETITGGLKTFLHKQSSLDGVEAPVISQKCKKQKINFDADAFTDSINKILDFRIPEYDDGSSSSSMSSYSDDEEEDVALNEDTIKKVKGNCGSSEIVKNMQSYMDDMDRELAKTNIGLSFEKLPFQSKENEQAPLVNTDIDSEEDDFQPVDVDLNALKNILESYSSEQGVPGPISSLFASMGMQLPRNADS